MKPLNLTVLVHEGPMARAYLGVLRAAGWRVTRVVLMVQQRDPADGRPVLRWAPDWLRRRAARWVQDQRMNHWPRQFLRQQGAWCRPWLQGELRVQGLDDSVLDAFIAPPEYHAYTDQVDEVLIDGLADPRLAMHLAALPQPGALLFTGGGLVPAALLQAVQRRVIHVHPGVLPQVRGADGLLWSMLLHGRPGATAFCMAPGLDTGEVIAGGDLDLPALPPEWARLDTTTRYRLLYAFVDPLLRALWLREVLAGQPGDPSDWPARAQPPGEGDTFHFMNPKLRELVFEQMAAQAGGGLHG